MPLSPPVGRQHLHTRRVTCQGFYRDDGLFDIEGRITDEKTYEHANEWRGPLGPGDFVHDMSIRLTLDHRFTIVDVEAVTDSSPYRICGDITPNFKKLIGLRIGARLHPRGARAAGRRAWLHPPRRAAGAGRDDGVPDRGLEERSGSCRPRIASRSASRPSRTIRPSRSASPHDRQLPRLGVGRRGHQALGAAVLHRPRRRGGARGREEQGNRARRLIELISPHIPDRPSVREIG